GQRGGVGGAPPDGPGSRRFPGPAAMKLRLRGLLVCLLFLPLPAGVSAAPPPRVYVILWFDTEDYLLPADDDAALHIAQFLSSEDIHGTFKVVGEKARTLQRRKRD